MDDVLRVDILHSLADLVNVVSCLGLRVLSIRLSLQFFVKLTLRAVLQNQVDLVFVVEEAIELDYILVAKMAVDLDLSPQLVSDV